MSVRTLIAASMPDPTINATTGAKANLTGALLQVADSSGNLQWSTTLSTLTVTGRATVGTLLAGSKVYVGPTATAGYYGVSIGTVGVTTLPPTTQNTTLIGDETGNTFLNAPLSSGTITMQLAGGQAATFANVTPSFRVFQPSNPSPLVAGLGAFDNAGNYAGLWFGSGVVAAATTVNYTVLGTQNGTDTFINAPNGTLYLRNANVTTVQLNSGGMGLNVGRMFFTVASATSSGSAPATATINAASGIVTVGTGTNLFTITNNQVTTNSIVLLQSPSGSIASSAITISNGSFQVTWSVSLGAATIWRFVVFN